MIYTLNSTEITFVNGGFIFQTIRAIRNNPWIGVFLRASLYTTLSGGIVAVAGFFVGGPFGAAAAVTGWLASALNLI